MEDIRQIQPLVLAYVGDAVHTLFVRRHFAESGDYKINELNRMVKEMVNAGMQCKVFLNLEPSLTEEEHDIAIRARNTAKGQKAKNYSVSEYNHATAFEALVGYLYLSGKQERLKEILEASLKEGLC